MTFGSSSVNTDLISLDSVLRRFLHTRYQFSDVVLVKKSPKPLISRSHFASENLIIKLDRQI
jgi:hypothetical protein